MPPTEFSSSVIDVISRIPRGRVASYGQIAFLAGNPRGARAVAWLLHSSTRKHDLPWHRVVNARGRISLPLGGGFEEQVRLLEKEDVELTDDGAVNLKRFGWDGV